MSNWIEGWTIAFWRRSCGLSRIFILWVGVYQNSFTSRAGPSKAFFFLFPGSWTSPKIRDEPFKLQPAELFRRVISSLETSGTVLHNISTSNCSASILSAQCYSNTGCRRVARLANTIKIEIWINYIGRRISFS